MKKFLAIVLALAVVFSFGAFAIAADEVTGTLADGTAVTKPVSEVAFSVEDGLKALEEDTEKTDALKAFFTQFDENEDVEVIAEGIINLGGAFAECTEDEIIVPITAAGIKTGDKVGVSLSNGTSAVAECEEDGFVPVAVPKDAENLGYVVSAAKEETMPDGTTWTTFTDGNGEDTTSEASPAVKG